MFIDLRYPTLESADLTSNQERGRNLSNDFVAFRGSGGKTHVLGNTCVHRSGSLSGVCF